MGGTVMKVLIQPVSAYETASAMLGQSACCALPAEVFICNEGALITITKSVSIGAKQAQNRFVAVIHNV
jgi:hypothetical protein